MMLIAGDIGAVAKIDLRSTKIVTSGGSPAMAGGRGPGSTRSDLLQHEIFAPWPGSE